MLIIKIQNDGTGDIYFSNYRYQVLVNETVIESGSIKNHLRAAGWQKLVTMLVEESLRSHLLEMLAEMDDAQKKEDE